MRHGRALDWLNFLLADVRGGLGPHVQVYLLTEARWTQAGIGAVLAASGLLGIMLHAPIGALIDRTHAKRALLIAGVALLSACALAIAWWPTGPVVLAADIVMAALGAVFAPTVAAITLGLTARAMLPARLGRNAAIDRTGNLFIAALIGVVGTYFTQASIFYLVPFFAVLASLAALAIPAGAIDHEQARGLDDGDAEHPPHAPAGWRALLRHRPLMVLALAAALFHFASAPMLPLAGQRMALANPGWEAGLTSLAIIVTQLTTIAMALLVTRANLIGRRPLLLAAFMALPLRGVLSLVSEHPAWLIALQILDGMGGGLFDALLPLLLADIMRGSGRYSLARGIVGTVQGVGGSISHLVAGSIVTAAGYATALASLTGVALAALALVFVAMPETAPARALLPSGEGAPRSRADEGGNTGGGD